MCGRLGHSVCAYCVLLVSSAALAAGTRPARPLSVACVDGALRAASPGVDVLCGAYEGGFVDAERVAIAGVGLGLRMEARVPLAAGDQVVRFRAAAVLRAGHPSVHSHACATQAHWESPFAALCCRLAVEMAGGGSRPETSAVAAAARAAQSAAFSQAPPGGSAPGVSSASAHLHARAVAEAMRDVEGSAGLVLRGIDRPTLRHAVRTVLALGLDHERVPGGFLLLPGLGRWSLDARGGHPWRVEEDGSVSVHAARPVEAGEPLLLLPRDPEMGWWASAEAARMYPLSAPPLDRFLAREAWVPIPARATPPRGRELHRYAGDVVVERKLATPSPAAPSWLPDAAESLLTLHFPRWGDTPRGEVVASWLQRRGEELHPVTVAGAHTRFREARARSNLTRAGVRAGTERLRYVASSLAAALSARGSSQEPVACKDEECSVATEGRAVYANGAGLGPWRALAARGGALASTLAAAAHALLPPPNSAHDPPSAAAADPDTADAAAAAVASSQSPAAVAHSIGAGALAGLASPSARQYVDAAWVAADSFARRSEGLGLASEYGMLALVLTACVPAEETLEGAVPAAPPVHAIPFWRDRAARTRGHTGDGTGTAGAADEAGREHAFDAAPGVRDAVWYDGLRDDAAGGGEGQSSSADPLHGDLLDPLAVWGAYTPRQWLAVLARSEGNSLSRADHLLPCAAWARHSAETAPSASPARGDDGDGGGDHALRQAVREAGLLHMAAVAFSELSLPADARAVHALALHRIVLALECVGAGDAAAQSGAAALCEGPGTRVTRAVLAAGAQRRGTFATLHRLLNRARWRVDGEGEAPSPAVAEAVRATDAVVAWAGFEEGRVHTATGDVDAATRAFLTAAHWGRALRRPALGAYTRMEKLKAQYGRSLRAAEAAIASGPAQEALSWWERFNAGASAMATARPGQALRHMRASVALNPTHVPTRINLATLYNQANRRAEAVEEAREALRLADALPPLSGTKADLRQRARFLLRGWGALGEEEGGIGA